MNLLNEKEALLALMPSLKDVTDNRTRLLYLCNMLRSLTDSEHGLTVDEILFLLDAKGNETNPNFHTPSKNTIHADLRALTKFPHLDTIVRTSGRGSNNGFWIENTSFDQATICLLINIVQACTFISQVQCNTLVERLRKMVPASSQDDIATSVFVDSRAKAPSVDVFDALRVISRALNEGKQISYRYTSYGIDGKKRYIDECAHGSFLHETPLDLVFSNNNYYLETWSNDSETLRSPRRLRLDRMEDVSISPENADNNSKIKSMKSYKQVEARTRMSIDMLGNGEPCHLFLRVNQTVAANIILNKFGYDCIIVEQSTEQSRLKTEAQSILQGNSATEDVVGIAYITVQLSPTFYRFLCGLGTMIQIITPDYSWADQSRWTKKSMENVPYEQLLSDYHRAVDGYKTHLRNVLSMYCGE